MGRIKGKEQKWGETVKIKMQPNKINLMIERLDKKIARQSQSGSAAMARFVYSIHLFLVKFI